MRAVMMATAWRSLHLLPRLAVSVVAGAALVIAGATPGSAQPDQGSGTAIPDAGVRPAPAGQVPLPGGSFGTPVPQAPQQPRLGPLAAQIAEKDLRINELTTELATIEQQLTTANVPFAEEQLQLAREQRETAEQKFDELVGESFRSTAALPPSLPEELFPELLGLSAESQLPVELPLGAEAQAREVLDARAAETAAVQAYELAVTTEDTLVARKDEIETALTRLRAERDDLADRNADLLVEQEREREEAAQENADQFLSTQPVNGFEAHPRALRAVRFALREIGKPYVWGTEGPSTYDCSGLTWRAYQSVGASIPRVASDQYWGTRHRVVTRSAAVAQLGLLPGDLVFFASGPGWTSIHHVGMYVGSGQMVHAPNQNERVQVSPIWWSRFYAATRVIPAVRSDDAPAPPQNPGTIDPDPTDPPPTTRPPTTRPPTTPPPTTEPPAPSPTTTVVPDVRAMPEDTARSTLQDSNLDPVKGANVVSDACTPGEVVEQSPAPGSRVPRGTDVTYRLCEAPTPTPNEPPSSETPGGSTESPTPTATGSATPT
jgi:cell wall-associated NlpC family hydrolase